MIINHNMGALNANRQMGINQANANKSMEKLSSGLKINRAGDDAAGLAISEKMRGQIRGLDQASANAQDGISLIQTAEGALSETHSILQRMRELSVQSSTDTNVEADRKAIQDEMNQLNQEIDRIANDTEFNTKKLLNGSLSANFQIGANENQTLSLSINSMNSSSLGLNSKVTIEKVSTTLNNKLNDGIYTVSGTDLLDSNKNVVAKIADKEATLSDGTTKITFTQNAIVDGSQIKISGEGTKAELSLVLKPGQVNDKLSAGEYTISGTDVYKDDKKIGTLDAGGVKLTLNDKTDIELNTVFGATKAVTSFTIAGADVSTSDIAQGTIKAINEAIETVSTERSKLGAFQNRLEHTIANLGTSSENLTSAESRIRDVNMAKEMSTFSKNNILSQAAQAMLAQANNQPQQVLQLLR